MTLVAMAGFDRYETVQRNLSVFGPHMLVDPRSEARGKALQLLASNTARVRIPLRPVLGTGDLRWVHYGFWYRQSAAVSNSRIAYTNAASGSMSQGVGITSAGTLTFTRGASLGVGTGTKIVNDGLWHHVHVSSRLTNTASGRLKLWVDGVLDLDITAATLDSSSNQGVNELIFLNSSSSTHVEFDDAWIDTDQQEWFAAKQLSIITLAPEGPGASTQWTPEPSGQPNWTVAGDSSDDTYISSQTAGQRDLYTFSDLPAGATSVEGVSLHTRGQQVGAGTPLVKPVHRHTDGTVTLGTDIAQNPAIADNAPQVWAVNPATGSPWTVADVNGAQFGIELG